jgi:insulysin
MLKSPNDNSEYQTFILENRLRVYLIQDPEISEAAASMKVGIGYFQDPVEIPGVAHFLEHMLFNGTKKYPKESEFQDFISKNNGFSNAYTTGNHTCYHYTVSPNKIIESLEMFGDFFAHPLLDENSIDREKEAVNSEHEKNILDDGRIKHYLFKTMCDEECWYHKFGTGDKTTLGIPNIRDKVKEFYETYYSADLMTLAITFKDGMEEIKKSVETIFSQIKVHPVPNLKQNTHFFKKSKIVKFVPVKDEEIISLHWDIPSFIKTPKQDPNGFLSHIIGNEAEHTIHSVLYQEGLIKDLVAGPHNEENRSTFYIEMKLTPKGMQNNDRIINVVYKYIDMLINNTNTERMKLLYQEQKELSKYHTEFFKKPSSHDRVLYLSNVNKYIDPNEVLVIDSLIDDYNETVKNNMESVLKEMIPEKCIVMIGSQKFKNENNSILQYYGAQYQYENEIISPSNENNELMELPEVNPYLSVGTDILEFEKRDQPERLRNDKVIGFWYPDTSYKTPDVNIHMNILFPNLTRDPKKLLAAKLYLSTVKQCLNTTLYQMEMGGYHIAMSSNDILSKNEMTINIFGNYEKMDVVFNTIFNALTDLELDENTFNIKKHFLKMDFTNNIYKSPYKRVGELYNQLMCDTCVTRDKALENIDNIQFKDILNIKNDLFSGGEIMMFCGGNISQNNFMELTNIASKLHQDHISSIEINYRIPQFKDLTYKKLMENDQETNSVVANCVYLSSQSTKDIEKYEDYLSNYAVSRVLNALISPDYFDTLRTKECYGYIVYSAYKLVYTCNYKQLYYMFLVQSSEKDFDTMVDRTDDYITEYYEKLKNVTQEEIDNICSAIIDEILAPSDSLQSKCNELINQIENSNFIQKNELLVKKYKTIKLDEIIKYYNDTFIKRKSVVVGLKSKKE